MIMKPMFNIEVVPADGNAFSIMGAVSKAMRRAGASDEVIKKYQEESQSGDYDNLIQVAMRHVNILI
jgi:hypothetical protein